MSHGKTVEPFWWGLFSAGGMIAAMLVPVMILLTGFLGPLGIAEAGMSYANLHALLSHVLVRMALSAVVTLSLFHCAHRIRHTLVDVGVAGPDGIAAALCYLGATVGGIACGLALSAL
jgi:fumarate reductase subunit D